MNSPIEPDTFKKPKHPLVNLIMFIYTMESFIYGVMNNASKNGDRTKINTLGPYAITLEFIMKMAPQNRDDIEIEVFSMGIDLYRGTGLPTEIIDDYEEMMKAKAFGRPATMSMFGFISTSVERKVAEKFAYNDPDNGKIKVLFHIQWTHSYDYYFMDMGSFDDEEEVLLLDGQRFEIVSIKKEKDF
jgi:hypothetical protein